MTAPVDEGASLKETLALSVAPLRERAVAGGAAAAEDRVAAMVRARHGSGSTDGIREALRAQLRSSKQLT